MASDFGTGKTLVVLAIVLGCFAILWPKIFYPMMQTAFAMTSPNIDADGRVRSENADRPPHLHPSSSPNPRARGVAGSQQEDLQDKFLMREGRPFPHPQARSPPKPQAKTGGAMSIIMPIYTVGIVVFFLYTVLKLVFKKPNEEEKKPLIKDFHMDPEYHKFVLGQQPSGNPPRPGKGKKHARVFENIEEEVEAKEMDPKDYEIFKLRKKLEETESAMEHIIKNMGDVTQKVAQQVEKKVAGGDVRQRRKGSKKGKEASRHVEEVSDDGMATLEEDLTELIGMCRATTDRAAKTDESAGSSVEEDSSDASMSEEEEVPDDDTRRLCKTTKVA